LEHACLPIFEICRCGRRRRARDVDSPRHLSFVHGVIAGEAEYGTRKVKGL
jgi:hypothetical protein